MLSNLMNSGYPVIGRFANVSTSAYPRSTFCHVVQESPRSLGRDDDYQCLGSRFVIIEDHRSD